MSQPNEVNGSQQFENMLHSLCFNYDGHGADVSKYDEVRAKLVERDRALLEAIREAKEVLECADYYHAAKRLESVLKELGEGV